MFFVLPSAPASGGLLGVGGGSPPAGAVTEGEAKPLSHTGNPTHPRGCLQRSDLQRDGAPLSWGGGVWAHTSLGMGSPRAHTPRPGECSDGLAVTSHFRPPEAWKLRFSPSWNVAPHGRWPGSLPRREGLHAEEGPGNGQRQPLTREQGYLASSGPCHLPGQALAHLAGESPAAPAQSVDPQDRKQIQCFLL